MSAARSRLVARRPGLSVASKTAPLVFIAAVAVAVLIAPSPWLGQSAAQMGMLMTSMHWGFGGHPAAAPLLAAAVLVASTATTIAILVIFETAGRPGVSLSIAPVERG